MKIYKISEYITEFYVAFSIYVDEKESWICDGNIYTFDMEQLV